MLSPGPVCRKSLSTIACFQISSSNLPSITGGLSKRGMTIGLAFSGGMTARLFASALLACWFGVAAAIADAVGEGELVCAATAVQQERRAPTRQNRGFAIIDYLSVNQRSARSYFWRVLNQSWNAAF